MPTLWPFVNLNGQSEGAARRALRGAVVAWIGAQSELIVRRPRSGLR